MTAPTIETRRPPAWRRGRVLRSALALVTGAATLAGCAGGGSASGGAGHVDEVTFLNILPLESLTYAPEMVADAKGLFAKHGLHVNFESTKGSAPAIQTVLAGSAQITRIGDTETMIAAGKRHAPLVDIGAAQNKGPLRMISSKRAPITTAEGFRGKLVGTPSEGGTSSITLDLVLASAGMKPDAVRRQVVGLAPGVFDLVRSGRVGAYIVSLDTSVLLQQTQPDAVIYNPNDDISSGVQIYVTSQQQLQDPQTKDELRRYLAAIRDAMQFITDDGKTGYAETFKAIQSRYDVAALKKPAVGRAALAAYVDSWHAGDGLLRTSPQRWNASYQEIVKLGQLQGGLDPSKWMTNELAPAGR